MTLVTIHLAAGQTPQQLIREIQLLNGGVQVRTVSGRFGVLVDAELAYRYLRKHLGVPEVVQVHVEVAAPVAARARKSRAASKVAADSNEEV